MQDVSERIIFIKLSKNYEMLKVEMTLFANAPLIAKNFVETSEKA